MYLAYCPGHDSTATVFDDTGIRYFFKPERYNRIKRSSYIQGKHHIQEILKKLNIQIKKEYTREDNLEHTHYNNHHKTHAACAFYNSGFEYALVFVIDRNGSQVQQTYSNIQQDIVRECETVFEASYPNKFTAIERKFWSYKTGSVIIENKKFPINSFMSIVKIYETATTLIGQNILENGKTMGLASYGEDMPYPSFFNTGVPNDFLFSSLIKQTNVPVTNQFSEKIIFSGHSRDLINKMTEHNFKLYADYAFQVQKQTQEELLRRVSYYVEKTGIKNVCISGGYGLNVVANGFLVKNLPNVRFFFEPLSDDSGISLGISYLITRNKTHDNTITPLTTTFFHGAKEDTTFKQNQHGETCTLKDIVSLLQEQKTIAVFNGLAEAGPRALGNRSILFDARNKNAKLLVNIVKKREWYRPFAATVLKEDFDKYFHTLGLEHTNFMTVSFTVKNKNVIPGVTHVDNTCRVQTVDSSIPHLYNLLVELKKQTGHSVVLNTSFNLAGEPLVETVEDALSTFWRSELDALWFPEVNKVIIKEKTKND